MVPKDVLIQTRVTFEQHQQIEVAATEQGLTIAAFLRKVAVQSSQSPMVAAWITSYGLSPADWLARELRAHYVLRRISVGANGVQTFEMFQLTNDDQLVAVPTSTVSHGMEWLRQPDRYQFVLGGSQQPWFMVRTTTNATTGLVELVLRPEGTAADTIRRRIYGARDGELVYDLIGGSQLRGRVDVLAIGSESCQLRLADGGERTLPYTNVVAVGT